MRKQRLLRALPMIVVVVGCIMSTGCTKLETDSRPHEDPDFEAVLPSNVAGRELARWSVRGRNVFSEAINRELASHGLTIDDFRKAVAGRASMEAGPPYLIIAFSFGKAPGAELMRDLVIDHPEAGTWSERTIGDKLVRVGTPSMLDQTEHLRGVPYLYDSGLSHFVVITTDETWAADALRELPKDRVVFKRMGDIVGADGAPMVLVPAGEFLMGSSSSDTQADANERPQHRVDLNGFYIDKYEVTSGQYRAFLSAVRKSGHLFCDSSEPIGKDHTPGGEKWVSSQQPVVSVDWYDASAYCGWAGKRLPTEAEWEKGARGTDGRIYPWGNSWESSRANSTETLLRRTVYVGSYASGMSPYGMEDAAGNVWEWVRDWYGESYYDESPPENPIGSLSGQMRVVRGGAAINEPASLRSAIRNHGFPSGRINGVGFRCAQDQE